MVASENWGRSSATFLGSTNSDPALGQGSSPRQADEFPQVFIVLPGHRCNIGLLTFSCSANTPTMYD